MASGVVIRKRHINLTIYHRSLGYVAQISNSLFQTYDAILLSTNVHLAIDTVDFRVEAQKDAISLGEVIFQQR